MWWYTLLEKNWQSAHASKLRNANFNHCLIVKIHFIVIFSKSNLIELSQHSRSQARVKEEGCVRFWQTSIKNSHSNGFETHKKLYKVVKAKVETGFRQAILMAWTCYAMFRSVVISILTEKKCTCFVCEHLIKYRQCFIFNSL